MTAHPLPGVCDADRSPRQLRTAPDGPRTRNGRGDPPSPRSRACPNGVPALAKAEYPQVSSQTKEASLYSHGVMVRSVVLMGSTLRPVLLPPPDRRPSMVGVAEPRKLAVHGGPGDARPNVLRLTLREFYPAALVAFDDLACPDALEVLLIVPTPTLGG